MNIVFFELDSAYQELFAPLSEAHHVRFEDAPLTAANVGVYADSQIISTFNESDTCRAVLERLPRLKHLALRKTGFDDVPFDYCDAQNISVSTVPNYGCQTVAEHAFALLLAISHRLLSELSRTRLGDFNPKAPAGFDLHGRTLGVIGTGNIGRHTVRIAKGFGMNVIAHDIRPNRKLAEEVGFTYLYKTELLRRCDVLSLHVPADESTFHLIGEAELKLMKPGAVLINTARGSVVDAVALLDALTTGRLMGAGMDVFPQEAFLREPHTVPDDLAEFDPRAAHELQAVKTMLQLPNVVGSPHVGYNTVEAIHRIMHTTLENIQTFLKE